MAAWFAFQVQPEISALDVVKPRALLLDRSTPSPGRRENSQGFPPPMQIFAFYVSREVRLIL